MFRLVHSYIHLATNCTHDVICSRTQYCAEICKPGTIAVSSWNRFVTRTQSSLSLISSLCMHQSIGTHNSAISAAYGYGVEDRYLSMILSAFYVQFNKVHTISQYYSITDQLNLGVRHIELDIHYFHSHLRVSHCGFSVGVINYVFYGLEYILGWMDFKYDTDTIGCFPSFNGVPSGTFW